MDISISCGTVAVIASIVLAVLKVVKVVSLSWFQVCLPMIIVFGIELIIGVFILIAFIITYFMIK